MEQIVNIILDTVIITMSDVKNLSADVIKLREENKLINKKVDILEKRIDNLESESKQNSYSMEFKKRLMKTQIYLEENMIQIVKSKLDLEVPSDALEKSLD